MFQNDRWYRKNRNTLHAVVANTPEGTTALYQVAKTISGAGPGLPGLMPFPAPDPIPDRGAHPGPPFPATVADLRSLTTMQLHQLAAFYNYTFGIVPGDSLDEQVTKFQAYITGD